jgi:dihydrofolate reductase
MSISLDGFVAGPDQSRDNPLGVGGLELHHWHLDEPIHEADARARDELMKPCGAYVMGRNMFGPVRGPWDVNWRGWWGDEPPYHAPVFVLTHYPRDPIAMEGGMSPLSARRRRPATSASTSPVAPPPCGRRSRRA